MAPHLDVHIVASPPGGRATPVLIAGAAVLVLLQTQHLAPAPPVLLVLALQLVQGLALPALLQPTVAVPRCRGLGPRQQPVGLQQLPELAPQVGHLVQAMLLHTPAAAPLA